jgi:hypothetical protein
MGGWLWSRLQNRKPIELPTESVVPEAYREWQVKVFNY